MKISRNKNQLLKVIVMSCGVQNRLDGMIEI